MSPAKSLTFDDASLRSFCDLLGARTGLQVRDKDRDAVKRTLTARCEALTTSASDYLRVLRGQKEDEGEWAQLMPLLTNGESYFERDKGQFALLRDTILPELIERRRARGENTLRLWSAGCSTGEEAYSLAMIVEALLPRGWQATILGTDINAQALQKARRGVYGAWSFRGVESGTRESFFRPVTGGYELSAAVRGRVTFGFCNLSADDWPDRGRGIADMDLIVCRNVLIYFQRATVAGVLSRFAQTLRMGGYLLTGHAELHDQTVTPLRARLFPESIVYQKEAVANPPAASPPHTVSVPFPAPSPAPRPQLTLFAARSVDIASTPRAPSPFGTTTPTSKTTKEKTADEWCAAARDYADEGRYEEAVTCCRAAIKANVSHVGAYLLWAHIVEEQGDRAEAKELLKKVIYLAPSQVEAYLELGAIYEREGDAGRARQMRTSALELLGGRTESETFSSLVMPRGTSVGELRRHVETLLGFDAGDGNA